MTLSEQQGNRLIFIILDGTEFVDDNYFVDLLALCAFEVSYRDPQPSPVEKVLFLIKRFYFLWINYLNQKEQIK